MFNIRDGVSLMYCDILKNTIHLYHGVWGRSKATNSVYKSFDNHLTTDYGTVIGLSLLYSKIYLVHYTHFYAFWVCVMLAIYYMAQNFSETIIL